MSVTRKLQLRRGTAAAWTSANPTLSAGEVGFETDTKKTKTGDGTTAWTSLVYNPSGTGTVTGTNSGDNATNTQYSGLAATIANCKPLDPRFKKAYSKIYSIGQGTAAQLKIFMFSDSMNGLGGTSVVTQWSAALARVYGESGTGTSPTMSAAGNTYAGDGSASSTASDYARWPTGRTAATTGAGGTLTFGRGGGVAYADKLKVYYVKEPGAGTFKVQTSTDYTNWSDEAGYTNVDASNGTMTLGIISISKTLGNYAVRIVGLTGTVYFPAVRFLAESVPGVEIYSMALGGLSLTNANLAPASVWGAFIADLAPDICTWEMKEGATSLATDLPTFWTNFTTYKSDSDWIFFGSTPLQTNDADQVAQNTIVKTHCDTYGLYYLDAYKLFGSSWTVANALGFMADGTHRSASGNGYLAGHMLGLGWFDFPTGLSPNGVRTTQNIETSGSISVFAPTYRNGSTPICRQIAHSGNQDIDFQLNRSIYFTTLAGATLALIDNAGKVTASSFTDGYITMGLAQINRASNLIEMQWTGSGGVRFFGNTAYPVTFTSGTGALTLSATARTGVYTVGTLPSASANARHQAWVSDANAAYTSANIGSTVASGGANLVPVYSNGTNWIIG